MVQSKQGGSPKNCFVHKVPSIKRSHDSRDKKTTKGRRYRLSCSKKKIKYKYGTSLAWPTLMQCTAGPVGDPFASFIDERICKFSLQATAPTIVKCSLHLGFRDMCTQRICIAVSILTQSVQPGQFCLKLAIWMQIRWTDTRLQVPTLQWQNLRKVDELKMHGQLSVVFWSSLRFCGLQINSKTCSIRRCHAKEGVHKLLRSCAGFANQSLKVSPLDP